MKNNFKKITAIAAGALMVGMTMGNAVALSPSDNAFDAVVYGANADSSDQTQAESISSWLGLSSGASSTVTGGEVFYLGKENSDEFQFGYNLSSVYSDLDDNEMESFLADGDYDDGSIDSEFTQKITLGTTPSLSLFADTDYDADKTPTIGFHFDDSKVLDYEMTLDDSDEVYSNLEGTDLPLMGREYYVLDATATELVLLDSAEKTMISEGETVNIGDKTITIEYIDADSAKFAVNGEVTDKLSEDGTNGDKYFELADESYLVLSENLYASKDTGISKAEISIGKGKITLNNDGSEVELNEDAIEGLTSHVYSSGTTAVSATTDTIKSIKLTWTTDDEEFLVEGGAMVMPGFETIKVLFNSIDFPSDTEKISIDNGETAVLNMENFDVDIIYATSESNGVQGDDGNQLYLSASEATAKTYFLNDGDRFLATDLDETLSEVEQLYYEVTSLKNDSNGYDLELKDLTDGTDDLSFVDEDADETDTSRGDVEVKLNLVYEDGVAVSVADAVLIKAFDSTLLANQTTNVTADEIAKITVTQTDSVNLHFDKVVSKTGMIVEIPAAADLAGDNDLVIFYEQDDDGDLDTTLDSTSADIYADLAWNSDDEIVYAQKNGTAVTFKEEADNQYVGYVESDLTSKIQYDTDADTYEITYFGDEVVADVSIASADAVVTSTSGSMVFTDAEKSSWANKNVILVGGSCINTATAEALGVSAGTCGAAFTDATGVGTGQYVIEVVADAFETGKTALVVAGFTKEDTSSAAYYLKHNMEKTVPIEIVDGNSYFGQVASETSSSVTLK